MKKNKIYWTTKNGNKIDIDDMTESHLRNVLKMIMRNKKNNITKKLHDNNEPYAFDYLWK